MTREEIIKEIGDIMRESNECDRMRGFDTCNYCCHKDEKGACVFNRYIAYKIADFLIKHETDLLKEFVEWYGEQVARDRNGRPIARVVASLDEWVEWFLEERK